MSLFHICRQEDILQKDFTGIWSRWWGQGNVKIQKRYFEILVATGMLPQEELMEEIDAVFNLWYASGWRILCTQNRGRTARAGRAGPGIYFSLSEKISNKIKEIERYTKTKIVRQQIPFYKDVEEIRVNTLIEDTKRSWTAMKIWKVYSYCWEITVRIIRQRK